MHRTVSNQVFNIPIIKFTNISDELLAVGSFLPGHSKTHYFDNNAGKWIDLEDYPFSVLEITRKFSVRFLFSVVIFSLNLFYGRSRPRRNLCLCFFIPG